MSGLLRIFYMQMQAAKVRTGSTHKSLGIEMQLPDKSKLG